MTSREFQRLISYDNLLLAWRRINTARNISYKRYFRPVYYAYEWAVERNLSDLATRLRGGSYTPKSPSRVYMPKPSGLHRAITLLEIEDQILLQAVANSLASKVFVRRNKLQGKCSFSNLLQSSEGIFFVEDWRFGYGLFQKKIEQLYTDGYRWVAQFDLAAFYDTISHELLLKTVFPKTKSGEPRDRVLNWMKMWSTPRISQQFAHGIPQGPIASDVLAELFLMPVDEQMCAHHVFVRYVDDIRLFGKNEREVRSAVHHLEVLCRDRGIIPHAKKFAITPVTSAQEALGALPSMKLDDADQLPKPLPESKVVQVFRSALNGKPLRIKDKSRARFALFRGVPSRRVRGLVLKLLPHHPEHIEAMVHYLRGFGRSVTIVRECSRHLLCSPDEYVQGELFQLLAPVVTKAEARPLLEVAVGIAKSKTAGISAKWGAVGFLCRAQELGLGRYANFVLTQPATVQALVLQSVPGAALVTERYARSLLVRESVAPGLAFSEWMLANRKTLSDFGIDEAVVKTQVKNVFAEMGLLHGAGASVDPLAEIIGKRFAVPIVQVWRPLFGSEYGHALQQAKQADSLYDMARSQWLNYQNSFNHALFLALQRHLNAKVLTGACTTIGKNGELVNFGSLLDGNGKFAKAYPAIASALEMCNRRRNRLDSSHPYDSKSLRRNEPLRRIEQSHLRIQLAGAYNGIIGVCKAIGL